MTEDDLADGLRLSRASGWNQTLEDWRLLLSLGPGLFRVACLEGEVVASGGAVAYGEALAWICMILVWPGARGRGVGTRIFDEVLERARRRVEAGRLRSVGLDATPAGRGIYLRRGFRDAGGLVRMRAEGAGSSPGPRTREPRTSRLLTPGDLEPVLRRDREVFGADRGAVLRWALASAPELARVAIDGDRVRGYCFGRHGDHSAQVGPLVADSREVALALVAACAAQPGSRPLVLDARDDRDWLDALASQGFREQRPFSRMYLDRGRPDGRPADELAVTGPEFG